MHLFRRTVELLNVVQQIKHVSVNCRVMKNGKCTICALSLNKAVIIGVFHWQNLQSLSKTEWHVLMRADAVFVKFRQNNIEILNYIRDPRYYVTTKLINIFGLLCAQGLGVRRVTLYTYNNYCLQKIIIFEITLS